MKLIEILTDLEKGKISADQAESLIRQSYQQMSVEQVEELAKKYFPTPLNKIGEPITTPVGQNPKGWRKFLSAFKKGYYASGNAPTLKVEGLKVDKEKEFQKVLKCLKNNKVMVDTREDGIYIRLAGNEAKGEAFTLHFALAYPFKK